jgi:hypothetical protein
MPPGSNPIPNHVLKHRRNDTQAVQTGGSDDPAAATLAAITTRPKDEVELLETESNTVASFPDYRRKIKEMMKWWKEHYSEAYEVLVFELPDTERNDKRLHYFGATHDFTLQSARTEMDADLYKQCKEVERRSKVGPVRL